MEMLAFATEREHIRRSTIPLSVASIELGSWVDIWLRESLGLIEQFHATLRPPYVTTLYHHTFTPSGIGNPQYLWRLSGPQPKEGALVNFVRWPIRSMSKGIQRRVRVQM